MPHNVRKELLAVRAAIRSVRDDVHPHVALKRIHAFRMELEAIQHELDAAMTTVCVKERDKAHKAREAGQSLYNFLKAALNSWIPAMAEDADWDEEEGDEAVQTITDLLFEAGPALFVVDDDTLAPPLPKET